METEYCIEIRMSQRFSVLSGDGRRVTDTRTLMIPFMTEQNAREAMAEITMRVVQIPDEARLKAIVPGEVVRDADPG